MKKSRFTEEQITVVLKQVERGVPLEEICWKYDISEQTFYRWKAKYASLSGVPPGFSRIYTYGNE